jgi:hypothetical protein
MSNLDGWNKDGHRYLAIDSATEKFEAALRAELGAGLSASGEALVASAVSLYGAILLTQNRLFKAHARVQRTGQLYQNLPVLTGSLLRTLRALGVDLRGADAGDDAPPEGATPEERRAWSKGYVDKVLSGGPR